MHGVELILISLLVAVSVLAATSRAIGVPYPIVLVLGGLVMGFLPGLPDAELEPELVLVIFLPPLLYSAAYFANLRDLKADLRAISLLAIGLVIATAAAVRRRGTRADRRAAVGGGVRAGRDRPPAERPGPWHQRPRGREPDQRRYRAGALPGGGRRRRRLVLAGRGGPAARPRRDRRHRDRPRRRLGDRGGPQAARRPAGGGHDLAPERVRGLRPGRAGRCLRGPGGGHDRHLRRLALARDLHGAHAAHGLLGVGDPDLPAQRAAVRADRPAAAADRRGPLRRAAGRAAGHRGGGLARGDRLPARLGARQRLGDPGARPAREPARAAGRLAPAHDPGLGGHARLGLARRRARPARRLPRSRRAAVRHLRRDLLDAGPPGPHPPAG